MQLKKYAKVMIQFQLLISTISVHNLGKKESLPLPQKVSTFMKTEGNSYSVTVLLADECKIQWQYNNINEYFLKAFSKDKPKKDRQWLRGKKKKESRTNHSKIIRSCKYLNSFTLLKYLCQIRQYIFIVLHYPWQTDVRRRTKLSLILHDSTKSII